MKSFFSVSHPLCTRTVGSGAFDGCGKTTMNHHNTRKRETDLQQATQLRHLVATADQLQAAYDQLQAERTHLQQQHHLLACLAEVWGEARCMWLDDELIGIPVAEVELLEQLTCLRMPKLALSSGCSAMSCASCGSTSDDLADDGCSSSSVSCGSCGRQVVPLGRPSTVASHAHSTSTSIDSSIPKGLQEPACPDSDPFMLLRASFNQPLDPFAPDYTISELCALWDADVQQLAAYLQQLEETSPHEMEAAAAPAAPAHSRHAPADMQQPQHHHQQQEQQQQRQVDPLAGIIALQVRMFTRLQTLVMTNRTHLFYELQITNRLTGERIQEPCKERHKAAIRALQLSPAQQQRLAVGWGLFQHLLAPIISECSKIHSQGVRIPRYGGAGSETMPPAPHYGQVLAFRSALTATAPVPVEEIDQGERLAQQRDQIERLEVLRRKDTMVRAALTAYMQGCLSWVQQARLRVHMSPFHVSPGLFYVAAMELMQEQQGQQPRHAVAPQQQSGG